MLDTDISKNAEVSLDIEADPIVAGLKRLYDSVLDEPIPDDFLSMLRQIDESAPSDSCSNPKSGSAQ